MNYRTLIQKENNFTTNLRDQFVYWFFDDFQDTEMFRDMQNTTEGSPWHRERNVAVHTQMVVSQYLLASDWNWNHTTLLGALACAFHDVGKPHSMQAKWKAERGNYFSFGGHELKSARMWEDWACENARFYFPLSKHDIYVVGWMIENHLPWGMGDDKVMMLVDTLSTLRQAYGNIFSVYINFITADTYGRMSDDSKEKREKVTHWITNFTEKYNSLSNSREHDPSAPKLYVPIAASGTGKSTLYNQHYSDANVFSLDLLRLELYSDNYTEAFKMSTEDKQFMQKAQKHFNDMLKEGNDLYVDNTNLSRKRRKMYLVEAKKRGYVTVALLFVRSKEQIINQQKNREDKNIPVKVSLQQYDKIQYPSYGEFDRVVVK